MNIPLGRREVGIFSAEVYAGSVVEYILFPAVVNNPTDNFLFAK